MSDLMHPSVFLNNWRYVTDMIFLDNIFFISFPATLVGIILKAIIAILVFLLIYAGFRSLQRQAQATRGVGLAAAILILFWYGVHSLWLSVNARYPLPVLPLVMGFVMTGLIHLYDRTPRIYRKVWILIGLLWGINYVHWNRVLLRPPLEGTLQLEWHLPQNTWNWIRHQLPKEARLMNPKAAEVYLYTQRHAVIGFVYANDPEEFRYAVQSLGITHILARPQTTYDFDKKSGRAWRLNQRWSARWPEAFRRVYANPDEGTTIYEVAYDSAYQQAYTLYREARENLENGRTDQGLQKLDHALAVYPHLVCALNAYGAAYLLSGRDLTVAENKLKQAIHWRPDNALALLNLARVYHAQGQMDLERNYLNRAKAAVLSSEENTSLLPVLDHEAK
jgi:tetratricopeptide (TPR) repeat protein